MSKYFYKYKSGDKWILLEGKGNSPKDCEITWSSSDNAGADLQIVKENDQVFSPKYKVVNMDHKDCKRNIYIQSLKMMVILREGYKCIDYDIPEDISEIKSPDESLESEPEDEPESEPKEIEKIEINLSEL